MIDPTEKLIPLYKEGCTVKLVLIKRPCVGPPLSTGSHCMKVKINSKGAFGTQSSGLYREVVS